MRTRRKLFKVDDVLGMRPSKKCRRTCGNLFSSPVYAEKQQRLENLIPEMLLWTLYRENCSRFLFKGGLHGV